MQLWKKNFLVTFLLFLVVIQGSLLALHVLLYRGALKDWIDRAVSGEEGIAYMLSGYQETDRGQMESRIEYTVREYLASGIRISVSIDGEKITDHIPPKITGSGGIQTVTWQKKPYILIRDSRSIADGVLMDISYMEGMDSFYHAQKQRTIYLQLLSVLISVVIGVMLYLTMKRINRPVSQIAHELRTPLTGIQGYAEYLMMGNISGEDRFFAAAQIVESSLNMKNIVEKLLIMGGMREGRVQMQRVKLPELIDQLKVLYPDLEVNCGVANVQGDPTLMRCLLENLVHNAMNAGEHVKLIIQESSIIVWNDGEPINEKKLRLMNRGQGMHSEHADRHGFGIGLCHEIAGVHGWKLVYSSSQEEGTAARIMI